MTSDSVRNTQEESSEDHRIYSKEDILDKIETLKSIVLNTVRDDGNSIYSDFPGLNSNYKLAKSIYKGRRARTQFINSALLGEPFWDIILDLYIHHCEGRQVSITSACIGAAVPPTTGLRWINLMVAEGYAERIDDACDLRRSFLVLTAKGVATVDAVLEKMRG